MFAGIKTALQTHANGALCSVLLVLGLTSSLLANHQHTSHDKAHPHSHHGHQHLQDAPASTLKAAAEDQAQAFSLGSLFGLHDVTLENFPVEPVAAIARKVAAEMQPGIQRPIHVVMVSRRERTPLAAVSRNTSMCIIVLNTNPDGWAVWDRFFGRIAESERMNVVELAVAHELGHCAEREMNGMNHVADAFNPLEGEIFADIYATLYAQQYMEGRSDTALKTLRQLREEFASAEPTHATGERLKALAPQFESMQHLRMSPVLMAQTAGQLLNARLN